MNKPNTLPHVYRDIISIGIKKGYSVIPEFKILLEAGKHKKVDLVWAIERNEINTNLEGNFQLWDVKYLFEIEGCDVSHKRIDVHKKHFEEIKGNYTEAFVILYTEAVDRTNWQHPHNKTNQFKQNCEFILSAEDYKETVLSLD